jgi:hypothetical protein
MTKQKIFGIGLNKTGTSSLGRFFQNNGYKMHEDYSCLKIKLAKDLVNKKNMDKAELILDIAENADVFEDWPWPLIYVQCLKRFPDAKFILTVRESPEKWFDSLYFHCRKNGPTQQIKSVYGHYTPYSKTRKQFIDYYTKHNADVIKFFHDKPGKLLVLSMNNENKGDVLSKFVKGLENTKFPIANKRKTNVNTKDKPVEYPQIYSDEMCKLLFETKYYIEQSFVNYSLLDIMYANIAKSEFTTKNVSDKKSEDYQLFAQFAIKYAMSLKYRQAIMYFVKKYDYDINHPMDFKGNTILDFAKSKDPKLLAILKRRK